VQVGAVSSDDVLDDPARLCSGYQASATCRVCDAPAWAPSRKEPAWSRQATLISGCSRSQDAKVYAVRSARTSTGRRVFISTRIVA
jgi:hypothetical protein